MSTAQKLRSIDQAFHNRGISKAQRHSEIFKLLLAMAGLRQTLSDEEFSLLNLKSPEEIRLALSRSLESSMGILGLALETTINTDDSLLFEIVPSVSHLIEEASPQLTQDVFMYFGPSFLKKDLDQYWTPVEVVDFMCGILRFHEDARIIDPAGGSGDFLTGAFRHSNQKISLHHWDQSEDATQAAKLNLFLSGVSSGTFRVVDSIDEADSENGTFDFCITNPPFGTRTVWPISKGLGRMEEYDLGHKWNNGEIIREVFPQQLGILFIERSLKLLKKGGILGIVLPSGYMSNPSEKYVREWIIRKHRLLAVISLPGGAFSNSGAGVTTDIVFIKAGQQQGDYPIFVDSVSNIGFDCNRKNAPKVYRHDPVTGELVRDASGNAIADNDLPGTLDKLRYFAHLEKIVGFKQLSKLNGQISTVMSSEILGDANQVLSPRRYSNEFMVVQSELESQGASTLTELGFKIESSQAELDPGEEYVYLDIGEIGFGTYSMTNRLRGWQLPGRAKYLLRENQVLVSRLGGSTGKFCFFHGSNVPVVATSGVFVISHENLDDLLNFYAFLFTKSFSIQFKALATGSIMEDVKKQDFMTKIKVPVGHRKKYSELGRKMVSAQKEIESLSQSLQ